MRRREDAGFDGFSLAERLLVGLSQGPIVCGHGVMKFEI